MPISFSPAGTPRFPRHYWLFLIPVFLITVWLGARRLNAEGFWYDEWWSLYTAGASYFGPPLSLAEIWNRQSAEEPMNPPGYFIALSFWGRVAGWTEFATRSLSLFVGLLAMALTYQLARTFTHDSLVGLSAAVAMGTSVWFIRYLYESRTYAFYVAFATLVGLIFFRLNRHRPALYIAFVAAGVGLLYTHYFGIVLLSGLGFRHGLSFRPSRHWWLVLACLFLIGILFLPWFSVVLTANAQRIRVNQVDINLLDTTREILYVFSNASLALFGLLALSGLRTPHARSIWLVTVILFVLNVVAMRLLRLNELRYALDLLPFLALVVGLGVRALIAIGPGLVLALWVVSALLVEDDPAVANVIQRFPSERSREMAQVVRPYLREDDVVINILGDALRSTIQHNPLMFYLADAPGRKEIVERVFSPSLAAFVDRVRSAVDNAPHVWVLYAPRWPSTEWSLLLYLLDQWQYKPCLTLSDTQDLRIIGFAKLDNTTSTLTFGDGIGAHLIDPPEIRAGAMQVWLGFAVQAQVPPETYSISIRLEDQDGNTATQFDTGLPGAGNGCQLAQLDVSHLPPGKYWLKLIVYDWRTLARLPGFSADGEKGDNLSLVTITK